MSKAKRLLVTGGAGYIGSHMVAMLLDQGHGVVTLDNLSKGRRDNVLGGTFHKGDVGDKALLEEILLGAEKIDGVLHFAASIEVGESVEEPDKYILNNYTKTLPLLELLAERGGPALVFSSTAAIFGSPQYLPINENHPKAPENPYARSKLMVEDALEDLALGGLKYVSLRYFNAAGADPAGRLGEFHDAPSHLIPRAIRVAGGLDGALSVHGRDYATADGTGVRDYIHVSDLCKAHLLALERLWAGGASACYNLGNGRGFSVLEVVEALQKVAGRDIPLEFGPRRAGDIAQLVADSRRAGEELGWKPEHGDLESILADAWRWHLKKR